MAHHLPHAGGAVAAEIPAGPRSRFAALQALHNRDYRFLWLGQLGQSASLWVETVARSWLVWELTGSATALGTVNLLRSVPMLIFGILAGAAADRMDKKRLLTICQFFTMVNLLSLAIMIRTDNLQLWAVYLTSFFMGSSMAFLQPARTSLIPSLVKREELTNAVALNNAAMNVTRIVGPALAGTLIPVIGVDGIYFSAAAFYLWTIWSTNQIKVKTDTVSARKDSVWGSIKEGLRFCWGDKTILTLMLLALIPMMFGMPYMTLMPVVADKVLSVGPQGFGILFGASGIGAVLGSLVVASVGGNLKRKWIPLTLGVLAFGGGIMALGLSKWLLLSMLFIAMASAASTGYMALTNAALLENTPAELRGRVMSVYMLDRGLIPLGTMFVALVADNAGAPLALTLMGGICVTLGVVVALFVPAVRRV